MSGNADEKGVLLVSIIKSLNESASVKERNSQKTVFEQKFRESDARLDQMVQGNYADLTQLIQGFSSITDKVQSSRDRLRVVRESVSRCRQLLRCRRDELRKLWVEGVEQRTINALLTQIEEVKAVPEQVEQYLTSKHYLHATDLLVRAVNLLQGDLSSVDALKELKQQLIHKRESLHQLLSAEIHRQLYEVAPDESKSTRPRTHAPVTRTVSSDTRPVRSLSGVSEIEHDVIEDLTTDPEADSDHFLAVLVEALATLGKLPEALHKLRTQTQPQLLKIVQRSTQHVLDNTLEQLEGSDAALPPSSRPLLQLLDLLCRQFRAVTQAHGTLLRHIRKVKESRSRGYGDLILYEKTDVWKKVQQVMQYVLGEYLSSDNGEQRYTLLEQLTGNTSSEEPDLHSMNIGSYFGKKKPIRQRAPLFKFENSSQAMSVQMYLHDRRKKRSVTSAGVDGAEDGDNKPLYVCKPDPKNIKVIFKSLQKFIVEIENETDSSPGTSSLQIYVTDFVKNSFLKQVHYEVSSTINIVTKGYEAFRSLTDNRTQHELQSDRPLLHSTALVFGKVQELEQLLQALPAYSDQFLLMVSRILQDYHATCQQQYNTMLHLDTEERRIISGAWAMDEDITRFLRSLPNWHQLHNVSDISMASHTSTEDMRNWNTKESEILTANLSSEALIPASDVIGDPLQLRTLANLQHSLEWFSSRIQQFVEELPSSLNADQPAVGDVAVVSPVSEQSLEGLLSLARQFRALSDVCLLTLHLELRVHCFHFLLPVAKQSNYWVSSEDMEPDSNVTKLNRDLSALEEALATALTPKKLGYLFVGLGHLVGSILINSTHYLTRINEHGVKKMCRNIFALQQNITNMTNAREADLDRARQYFEMLYLPPDIIVKTLMEQGACYSELEYVSALTLLHRSQPEDSEERHEQRLAKLKHMLREYQV